ncbi:MULTISPECIES: phage major capsid protein [unclassified Gemella]|uniref:phage major capsid protein n=1 Tax=unclassified Gemella TaxID=2624949 RepID=UPI001C050953|nr:MULTISPECIES: phage major capsid protein [unclassified Gemella]MBU0279309.1 phage major capsid protein [Gemella sp. zg-1178]QWQ38652.1 phage major capsid protein [Gemella sp. zg-570]
MNKKIQELIEKRAKAWEGAKAFVESKKDSDGLLSKEDVETYNKMEEKVKNFTFEIERLQEMENMERELSKPVNDPLISKPMVSDKEDKIKKNLQHKKAMIKALRSNFRQIENILQEKVDTDGGYLVPDEYDSRLVDTLEEENIIRKLSQTLKTNGGTYLDKVSTIKADDVINLVHALKRPYRKNAVFITNDKIIANIRKLKDNNGAYIWQPSYQLGEPDKLAGYPVYTSAFAPENKIAFGDFSYYNIGDRGARSFKELQELFAGNGMIGFVAKERVDGKLVLPEAVQILPIKG